jgi:hypothetical protein
MDDGYKMILMDTSKQMFCHVILEQCDDGPLYILFSFCPFHGISFF